MSESSHAGGRIDSERTRSGQARTLAVVVVLTLGAVVANVVASLLLVQVMALGVGEVLTFALELVAIELSFLAVGVVFVSLQSSVEFPIRRPNRDEVRIVAGGVIAALLTVTLSYAITDALVPSLELSPGFAEYTDYSASSTVALSTGAVLSVLLVGPVEEFLFRGVVQGRLRTAFGPVAAIGVAGLVFAFFHVYPILVLSSSAAVLVHMTVYYTAMGAIFGIAYERTGNLAVPAIVHGTFNAITFLAMIPA